MVCYIDFITPFFFRLGVVSSPPLKLADLVADLSVLRPFPRLQGSRSTTTSRSTGTALLSPISTVSTFSSWECVGIHSHRVVSSPLRA